MNKIRPFRDEPVLLERGVVGLAYILLGWIVTSYPVQAMGNLLSLFLILGILVWIFIIRNRKGKYFVRYHLIQAILLNMSLSAIIWLLISLLNLLGTLPGLDIVAGLIYNTLFERDLLSAVYIPYISGATAKDLIIMTIAVVTAFYGIMGRYTELPWITDGVRHWL